MKLLRANCAKPNRQPLPKPNSARQVLCYYVNFVAIIDLKLHKLDIS